MEVIVFESESFYKLIDELVKHIMKGQKVPNKWILEEEAMKMLGGIGKTQLWRLRSKGLIRYSQPSRKIILYDRDGILAYLEKHAHDTF